MAINVSKYVIQRLVSPRDIILLLLTQGYYHWGTFLNAMKRLSHL